MKQNKPTREELALLTPGFQWPEKLPEQDVPENYFNKFPEVMKNRLRPAVSSGEAPIAWRKQNPYQVPADYFGKLPDLILEKINQVPALPSPQPQMQSARPSKTRRITWRKWTAAAIITALIATGGLVWQRVHQSAPIEQQLGSISNGAIELYLTTQTDLPNSDLILSNMSISNEDLKTLIKELRKGNISQ